MLNESLVINENSDTVKQNDFPDIPMLIFTSDETALWVQYQEDFAKQTGSEIIYLNSGHYIHHFEYASIAEQSKIFLQDLE